MARAPRSSREDWTPFSAYRGQNANMHLTEALMAAFEATGERELSRQGREHRRSHPAPDARGGDDWRVPEHYTRRLDVDRDYKGSDMFRPYGVTPGHALEWTRLALQLWELGGRRLDWLPDAARGLFAQAVGEGWDEARGGFYYTLEWSGAPRVRDRLWWPCCEGIGAATLPRRASRAARRLRRLVPRIWDFAARHFIDRR